MTAGIANRIVEFAIPVMKCATLKLIQSVEDLDVDVRLCHHRLYQLERAPRRCISDAIIFFAIRLPLIW